MAELSVSKGDRIEWKSGSTGRKCGSIFSAVSKPWWYYYFLCSNSAYVSLNASNDSPLVRVFGYSPSERSWKRLSSFTLSKGSSRNVYINYGSNHLSGSDGMIHFCIAIRLMDAASGNDRVDCYMGNYTTMSESLYNRLIKGRPIYGKKQQSPSSQVLWGIASGSTGDQGSSEPIGPQSVVANPFDTDWGDVSTMRGREIATGDVYRLCTYY